jgi:hypothetical protein
MSIAYCAVNKITIKNNYPLLSIDDLLDWFNGTKYLAELISHWGTIKSTLRMGTLKKQMWGLGMADMSFGDVI